MTGDGRDREFGLRPGAMQVVRGDRGSREVVTTFDDDPGNPSQSAGVRDQLAFCEPAAVEEIVVLDCAQGQRECRIAEVGNEFLVRHRE